MWLSQAIVLAVAQCRGLLQQPRLCHKHMEKMQSLALYNFAQFDESKLRAFAEAVGLMAIRQET